MISNNRNFAITQSTYDHSYITSPSPASNNNDQITENTSDTIIASDENELIDIILEDIDFENCNQSEEQSADDNDSLIVEDEDYSNLDENDIELIC